MKMPWLMNKTRPADTDDVFEAADTPTPPHPDPRPEPEPPRPEPAYEDPRNTATEEEFAPGQEGRLLWVLPAVMTLASAVFTLWSVWDLATGTSDDLAVHAAGLAAGVVVEGGWVWMLILAHRQAATGRITTWNAVTGWILAVVTALILLAHGIQTGSWGLGLLAGLPLIAKAAWHGLTTSRAEAARVRLEAKQKEAKADDDSLTVAQRQRLAELRRQAKFTAEEAKALRELNDAQARAKHEAKLAQTNRETQQAMAQMEATAGLMVRKAELEERIELASPLRRQALALGSGFFAPDDASALGGDTGMGFASAMAQARMQAPTVRTGPDQEVPRVPGKVPTPTVQTREHPSVVEARRNRAACGQAFQELLEELGEVPSIAAVATAAGVSDRAAGRHLRALGLIPPASKSTD